MLIIRVMGGLGNQMQQYALYRKFESMGKEARLDVSWFADSVQDTMLARRKLELGRFEGLPMEIASEDEIRAVLGRLYEEPESSAAKLKRKVKPSSAPFFVESDMFHPEILAWSRKYLVGYWACEAYYADIMGQIRDSIRFPESADGRNRETAQEMSETQSVSIHIRRGDYLDAENVGLFGNICTDAYYDAAVAYIKEKFPQAVFYVFSDDTAYAKERYAGKEYRVIDWNKGAESFYDMMLMSRCRHNICANSTFSFWGARLNANPDKVMIRPSIHKNTQRCVPQEMKRLWQGWTLLTNEGQLI